jgi:hypothetical protein
MKKDIKFEGEKAILCCGGKKCPSLIKNEKGMIEIEDDFGGKVIIREDQAKLIDIAIKEINKKK